jgi:hypothetical protein
MKLIPLAQAAAQVKSGQPLPFSVRDAQGGLLLARGNLIAGDEMRDALLERGAFVDAEEVRAGQRDSALPAGERRFNQWRGLMTRLNVTLHDPAQGLETTVRGIASELAALVQADPDMAQALLVHPELCAQYPYSIAHSMHVAAVWALIALRQEGAKPETLTVPLAAALTMNLAMLSLQDRLTHQDAPPKPVQREQIQAHPRQGVEMLRAAGVTDAIWLALVEQHHEEPEGVGYPAGLAEPLPEARRLHMIDIFCASFGGRAQRPPMLADAAARRLFQQHAKDPTALALAKEFGLYPPGSIVRLTSLEVGLVVRRGAAANTPLVVVLQNAHGEARSTLTRRDTAQLGFAVVAVVSPALLRVRIPWAQLFTLF